MTAKKVFCHSSLFSEEKNKKDFNKKNFEFSTNCSIQIREMGEPDVSHSTEHLDETWGQCYKTFYGRKVRIFLLERWLLESLSSQEPTIEWST
jgi:hypothetical protein